MSAAVAVEFIAEVRQVKTMADHTVNITLNLPEDCIDQAQWFMAHVGDLVKCVTVVEAKETNVNECKF